MELLSELASNSPDYKTGTSLSMLQERVVLSAGIKPTLFFVRSEVPYSLGDESMVAEMGG